MTVLVGIKVVKDLPGLSPGHYGMTKSKFQLMDLVGVIVIQRPVGFLFTPEHSPRPFLLT